MEEPKFIELADFCGVNNSTMSTIVVLLSVDFVTHETGKRGAQTDPLPCTTVLQAQETSVK